ALRNSGIMYRPRSSVTTILRNLVPKSVVSAITHTPASGPFELVTTPPILSGPTFRLVDSDWGAERPLGDASKRVITAKRAKPRLRQPINLTMANPGLNFFMIPPLLSVKK